MPIKRSSRFRARLSKAPKRLVKLRIKWPPLSQSTPPATNAEALDAPSSAARATSPPPPTVKPPPSPPIRTPDLSPISFHPPTNIQPTPNDCILLPRQQISREDRQLLTSIIRAVFTPSTDLPAFFSALDDLHILETARLLGYLYTVELEHKARYTQRQEKEQKQEQEQEQKRQQEQQQKQQSLVERKFVEGVDGDNGDDARAYLSVLGRKVRRLAEENDAAAVAG